MNLSIKKQFIFWLIPVGLLFLWYFRFLIFPFLAGLIFGSSIQSLAYYLNYRLKINFYLAVFLIYIILSFFIITLFYLTIKVLIEQTPSLLEKLQPYTSIFKSLGIKTRWQDILSLSDYVTNVLKFISSFLESLLSLGLIFIISLYISLSKNFPENVFNLFNFGGRYFKMWRIIRRKLSFWLLGQITAMVFIGLITYIFFGLILKVKYALLISLVAGLLEIVPILGPIATLIIALFIIFLENSSYVLPTIIFSFLLQQFENHFLIPLIMKKAINLHPLLVILGISIGAKIYGILGIITILPILGGVVEIFNLARSSKGRTPPSGGGDPGSNPGLAT